MCSKRPRNGVPIEILDTEVGFPVEALPYIYDEFYQVGASPNSSRDGYGFGVSMVRRQVAWLGFFGVKLEVQS